VGTAEYVVTPALFAGAFTIHFVVPSPEVAYWTRPVWFDVPMRNALVSKTSPSRRTAGRVSDVVALASMAQPLLIDSLFVVGFGDKNSDVAWQMQVINAQSYAITLLGSSVAKRFFARERPYGSACAKNPRYTEDCKTSDRFRSYYSGHAAITATGAGLVCAHHTHLPIYGGSYYDPAACLVALAGTIATGTLRIASDRHWTTDVITGHIMGLASGFLLPSLVYYGQFNARPPDSSESSGALMQRPQLVWSGTF
jgi:membrane-associated phospholipid phosphatase